MLSVDGERWGID